jgi:hypothetical protein
MFAFCHTGLFSKHWGSSLPFINENINIETIEHPFYLAMLALNN